MPHAALQKFVDGHLKELEDEVRWQFEDTVEVGADDDTPMKERVAAVEAYVKALDTAVYGKRLPSLEAIKAWLKKQK